MSRKDKERVFRMKRFEVNHSRSANKVGVDGVMIGAWATVSGMEHRILDAGCGCGLIALMLAQRNADAGGDAIVEGIDIEPGAVDEASGNFSRSEWSSRLVAMESDFSLLADAVKSGMGYRYDLIVSNPPFFHAGADNTASGRMLARHAGALSPEALLGEATGLLSPGGRLAYIAQSTDACSLRQYGEINGLTLSRMAMVRGNHSAAPKRVMMEWINGHGAANPIQTAELKEEEIVIEYGPGDYTPEYIALCHEFYLRM